MGFGANLYLVPVHFNADSRAEITRLCTANNLLNAMKYNYGDMFQENDGTYTIQFFADIREWKDPTGLSDEEIEFMKGF